LIFLIVSVIMVGVIYGYCGWRLLVPLELPSHLALASWLCLTVLALLPHLYLGYVRRSNAPERLKDWLAWAAYLGLGWVTITFSLLVVSDLVRIMWFGVEAALPQLYRFLVTDLIDPARVLSRANVGVIGLAALLTARGLYAARRNPRVVDVTVPIDGLPPSLQGFRIAQITDLHVGPTIKGDFVAAVVETVNDLHVDLIAFTGDLADGSVQRHRSDVAPLALLRAVHGCYFVTGNHEYYSGVEEWVDEARRLGMEVLLNEHCIVRHGEAELTIAGVTDYAAAGVVPQLPDHASDPESALMDAPDGTVRLLLAHQPRSALAAAQVGFDLMLCGHTHGGQLLPWHAVVALQQTFVSGLHRLQRSWVYVSRGAGYWGPPVRLGAPSEITHITLVKA
jgi:predicted MPP superfamily phosphohydrolase